MYSNAKTNLEIILHIYKGLYCTIYKIIWRISLGKESACDNVILIQYHHIGLLLLVLQLAL